MGTFLKNNWGKLLILIMLFIPAVFFFPSIISAQDPITQLQTRIFIYQLIFSFVLGLGAIFIASEQLKISNSQVDLSNKQIRIDAIKFSLIETEEGIKDSEERLKKYKINSEGYNRFNDLIHKLRNRYDDLYGLLQEATQSNIKEISDIYKKDYK